MKLVMCKPWSWSLVNIFLVLKDSSPKVHIYLKIFPKLCFSEENIKSLSNKLRENKN